MGYQYQADEIYFVTYKTIDGEMFFDTDEKKEILKKQIEKVEQQNLFELMVYGIMLNHYHLIFRCHDPKSMPTALQIINGGSSYLLHKLTGDNQPIWNLDKFNWMIIKEEKLNDFMGYVLGNPLKHGLVTNAKELANYCFTNYNEMVNKFDKDFIDALIRNCPKMGFEEADDWFN
jgi:REP element-mobilizing transposase RayT